MRVAAKRRRGATANRSEVRQLPQLALPGNRKMAIAAAATCFSIALILQLSGDRTSITDSDEQISAQAMLETTFPASDLWRVTKQSDAKQQVAAERANPSPGSMTSAPAEEPWVDQMVKRGDNLSLIFRRAGFGKRDVYSVVSESAEGKSLARIFPGQIISFKSDKSGGLAAVRVVRSPLETVTYRKTDQGFVSTITQRTPEVRESWATAEITSSLFMAGKQAGLSQNTIMELATIFGGVIDFVRDPRKGDTIQVVYQELYLDNEKYENGPIVAASFTNQGTTYNAFRYMEANGDTNYYNEDGVSMRKSFLLAPVDFTRISSNFNLRRLHPIYKTTRPHRGTDYAAPTGTPVYAAGDGRVTKAGYSRSNGNYVFIRHGDQYVTHYLHLNKRKVKTGQRVTQSQVIGTVGSTGAATGPHLHYEFLVNGVHRDPRKIHKTLPKAKSLPAKEMTAFRQSIHESSLQLATLRSDNHLALNSSASSQASTN